jgi:hypothetical protein
MLTFDFHFRIGRSSPDMSQRSSKLASYIRRELINKPQADEAMLRRNRILDEGFSRLHEQIIKEFEKQLEELQHEPDCGSALFWHYSDGAGQLRRADNGDLVTVRFDRDTRIVSFKCEKPLKLSYFIEVRLNPTETNFYYVAGEKKSDLDPTNETIVQVIVEKYFYALFNVQT